MLRSAILQPNAFPARTAISTAALFNAGRAPGKPRQTAQTCVFGAAPNCVEQPQKILLRVRSCACTSRPITGSKSETGTLAPLRERRHPLLRWFGRVREAQQRLLFEGPADQLQADGQPAGVEAARDRDPRQTGQVRRDGVD